MRVEVNEHEVVVHTEGVRYPSESAFWYALKRCMNAQGADMVKKGMSKDGHLVGDESGPYYLRDRGWRFCVYDDQYAMRLVHEVANRDHVVRLRRVQFTTNAPVRYRSAADRRACEGGARGACEGGARGACEGGARGASQ